MNRQIASKLVLSEEVYHDDLNREFKTYQYDNKEYRLYGLLTTSRLDGESQFEYRVRRIFMKERIINAISPKYLWRSKNPDNLRLYNIARRLTQVEDQSKIEKIKEVAYQTNLGTFDKKRLEKIVKEYEQQS